MSNKTEHASAEAKAAGERETKTNRISVSFEPFVKTALEELARTMSVTTSEIIRDAVVEFLKTPDRDASFRERSLSVIQSPYGRAKKAEMEPASPTNGKGPAPRYTQRIGVAFPESVYTELARWCHERSKGITTVIRLAVDTYLSRSIFDAIGDHRLVRH
ncbi:ribbon-helix-helix domain-containing protein [Sinomonas humi]|uniref:Ribbon-helix-helix protein CopG domain-containing protein n=1 Tax=Sinomonas humi TaxID=1338436 RepID=A0A0B2A9I5_9MICC|nr:CopG family transcriptional regulator [Sinomonas humi]KHL00234.1 hypothetical protein LK10_20700 [Sinomonas humi]